MKKRVKRFVAMSLAMIISVTSMCSSTMAEVVTEDGNVWHGDEVSVDVKAGTEGYTFMSVYPTGIPGSYEMSNHMVSVNGGVNNEIPQTLILVNADKDYTWEADRVYEFGTENNYDVFYCCDAETGYNHEQYYKRTNLEDSVYYDEEKAAHIRAIITNSYPYVSVEEMKKHLSNEGFDNEEKGIYAKDLTRAEIITAVQSAVWAYANVNVGDYVYSQTFDVPTNTQWGKVFHDYTNEMKVFDEETNEMKVWWTTGERKFSNGETVEARINALIDYLKKQDKVYAQKNQIVISDINIVNSAPVIGEDGMYTVDMKVLLNNSGSSVNDNIIVTVYVGDEVYTTREIELGTEEYDLSVKASAGQSIKAVVSGKQILPEGVYFYSPKGGRDVSQSLVGVAAGETDVYAEASAPGVTGYLGELEFNKIDALTKEPIENVEFRLEHDGDACTGCHGGVIVGNYEEGSYDYDKFVVKSDVNGLVRFENIPSGHTYTLKEKTPEGYVVNNDHKKVEVSFETVLVDGEEVNKVVDGEITNKLTIVNMPKIFDPLVGYKVWDDNSNSRGYRPNNIDLRLYQTIDGKTTEVKNIVIENENKDTEDTEVEDTNSENNESDDINTENIENNNETTNDDKIVLKWNKTEGSNVWSWTYINLPRVRNGKLITYSVKEVNVPSKYIMSQEGNVITNKYYNPPVIIPTPTPTPTPTPEPTEVPVVPSENPMDPTLEPEEPTTDPTVTPSVEPSEAPTTAPVDPTIDPQDPTVEPTKEVEVIKPSKAPLAPTAEVEVEKDKYESNKDINDDVDKEDKTPATSDTNNMKMYIMMMILSAYAFICMIIVRRTKSVN